MRSIAVLFALALTGCANHNWVAGPNINPSLTFEQQEARCRYMARHGGTAFAAAGDPNLVAGAALGHGIKDRVRQADDFDDCMVAAGYVKPKD
jgi:outer membrane lipoprotein SlyB